MSKKDASWDQILKMLDTVGWEKGFNHLLTMHKSLEHVHAFLAAGDYDEQKQASKILTTLVHQDETLVRIQILANDKGIQLDGRH
jgi:hypothetical protein